MSGTSKREQAYQGTYEANLQFGHEKNWTKYSEITELQETQDESKKLAQNEQLKREELSNKFENTIMEIKTRMGEENDDGSRKVNAGVDELYANIHPHLLLYICKAWTPDILPQDSKQNLRVLLINMRCVNSTAILLFALKS